MAVVFPDAARRKIVLVASTAAAVSLLHFLTPTGAHGWHWFHLIYQKLYYVPVMSLTPSRPTGRTRLRCPGLRRRA